MAVGAGKRNQTVVLDKEVYEVVNNLAWEQRRSFSNMTNMLLREVLQARGLLAKDSQK
ncbi:MAG: hypothetical protein ACM3X6_03740 [Patescibacteria group bacterium]